MAELSATPASTPTRRRVTAGLAVLAWCAAVAVAATAAWFVVDRAGISLLGGSGPGLTGAGAGAPTSSATSTAAASSAASSLTTAGGRVAASCTPAGGIRLNGAFPASQWRMEVKDSGGSQLRVEFHSGSRTVEVRGVCRSGVAVLAVDRPQRSSPAGTAPAPSASTTDDHGGGGGAGSGGGPGAGGSGGGDDGGSHGGGGGSGGGSGSGKSGGGSDG